MLSHGQHQTLLYIQDYISLTGGVAPTISEIASHFGHKSKSSSHRNVSQLVSRGYIRRLPRASRAIEVIQPVKPRVQSSVLYFKWNDETKALEGLT